VDVVDAVTASGLELNTFPGLGAPPPPRPNGEPARLIPGRDEAVVEPPPETPPAFAPHDDVVQPLDAATPPPHHAPAAEAPAAGTRPDRIMPPPAPKRATASSSLTQAVRAVGQWLGFVASGVNRPLPAGTTTGKRWGRLSWPLIVLVLMVLFALLGAAFMNRLIGTSEAGTTQQDIGSQIVTAACSGAPGTRGIIDTGPGIPGPTTTARDH
jgi:hypothetical protein